MISAVTLGIPELDESLSYLETQVANKIARRALSKGSQVVARFIRVAIPRTIQPRDRDKGIGWRVQGRASGVTAKAGVGVGAAGRRKFTITNRVTRRLVNLGKRGQRTARSRYRGGVGLGSQNLHWFALGTADRFTGARTWRTKSGQKRGRPTGNPRRYTGRIDKFKFGGFVQAGTRRSEANVKAAMAQVVGPAVEAEMAKRTSRMGMTE